MEGSAQREPDEDIDWRAIEESPEFQELVRKRKSFVLPGTIFFLAWYMGFILLTAYAESFMSERVYEGLTVGYCLALTQFLMVLVLGLLYLNRAENVFDPLAEKAIENYAGHHQRFARADDHGDGDGDAVGSRAATSPAEAGR
ncbi:MAG TPA: DUF485 domain-containing protein [Solirubrobacteraceae bacterium]|nr:DUF485 domain-containing protein [Solirubrobacteraceae bacterium]